MKYSFPLVMKVTCAITCLLTVAFALLHHRFSHSWLLSPAITFGTTAYHFLMRLCVGAVIPNKFHHSRKWFQPRSWEAPLYKKLGVKRWKEHVPTYNPSAFSLSDNTLEQVIANMCQAEVVHEVIVLCSFLPLVFSLVFDSFGVFLITSLLAAAFDTVFILLQRYNRPRLVRLMQKKNLQRS